MVLTSLLVTSDRARSIPGALLVVQSGDGSAGVFVISAFSNWLASMHVFSSSVQVVLASSVHHDLFLFLSSLSLN